MRFTPVFHTCKTSNLILWMTRSLFALPFVLACLAYLSWSLHTEITTIHQSNGKLAQEVTFLKQSAQAAAQSQATHKDNFSADKSQVIKALSRDIGAGLASIELPPVSGTKLRSISIETSSMSVEIEMPNLQASVLVTESLNGTLEPVLWKLDSVTSVEAGQPGASKFIGKWTRSMN